jgi:hypothetical protein
MYVGTSQYDKAYWLNMVLDDINWLQLRDSLGLGELLPTRIILTTPIQGCSQWGGLLFVKFATFRRAVQSKPSKLLTLSPEGN